MASFWRKSQEIVRDDNDVRAAGARAYFFAAGTLTPLTAFKDNALTTPHAHPLEADAAGRMPAVFLALASPYKERVETATGTLLWEVDHVDPAPAAASGGGGGGAAVDPLDLLDVGFVMPLFQTGVKPGWVRANGRTIGSAASGASERANADCLALFRHLWNATEAAAAQFLCPVSSGRGASAEADFAANKTLGLPDLRARSLAGLDDMGASAAARLAGVAFAAGSATTLGAAGGAGMVTLTTAELPAMTTGPESADHVHGYDYPNTSQSIQHGAGGSFTSFLIPGVSASNNTGGRSAAHTHTIGNGGGAHQNMPPFLLVTYYIKLNRGTA